MGTLLFLSHSATGKKRRKRVASCVAKPCGCTADAPFGRGRGFTGRKRRFFAHDNNRPSDTPRPGCCCSCKDAWLRLLPVHFPLLKGNSSSCITRYAALVKCVTAQGFFFGSFVMRPLPWSMYVFSSTSIVLRRQSAMYSSRSALRSACSSGVRSRSRAMRRQLTDAVHLFLCQGFALLSVFQAVQRGGDAPAAGDELRRAAAVDRHDRRAAEQPAELDRVAHLLARRRG